MTWVVDQLRDDVRFRTDVPRFDTPTAQTDYVTALREAVLTVLEDPAVTDRWARSLDAAHYGRPYASLPHLDQIPADPDLTVRLTCPRARLDQNREAGEWTLAAAGTVWDFAAPAGPLLIPPRHDRRDRRRRDWHSGPAAAPRPRPPRPGQPPACGRAYGPAAPGRRLVRGPWEGVRFVSTWRARDVMDATLVRPELVAEVSADTSIDRGGVFRHPMRFQRLRTDVRTGNVAKFGEGRSALPGKPPPGSACQCPSVPLKAEGWSGRPRAGRSVAMSEISVSGKHEDRLLTDSSGAYDSPHQRPSRNSRVCTGPVPPPRS